MGSRDQGAKNSRIRRFKGVGAIPVCIAGIITTRHTETHVLVNATGGKTIR
jgi:hypothetical protein